jgi:hypothetical protein
MTRWWGIGSFFLWIVFFPLYLVLRATRGHVIDHDDGPNAELLPSGDILVPVSRNGSTTMVRLHPGEEEHAQWLGYLQRRR